MESEVEQMNSPSDAKKKTLGVAQEAEAEARSRRRQVIGGQWEWVEMGMAFRRVECWSLEWRRVRRSEGFGLWAASLLGLG